MSKYGTGMRSCCDSLLRGNRPHIIGCEQYTPQDSQTLTADEQHACEHDFRLHFRSSIKLCKLCGVRETPTIAGQQAAKRAMKEAVRHFGDPPHSLEIVTTREEWEAAQHALAALEACSFYSTLGKEAGSLAVTVRKVLNRLPAAKEPPTDAALNQGQG